MVGRQAGLSQRVRREHRVPDRRQARLHTQRPARLVAQLAEHGIDDTVRHWEEALKRWTPRLASPDLLRGLSQAARFGCRLLVTGDELWPSGLDDLQLHAPHALWARGDVSRLAALDSEKKLLSRDIVAVDLRLGDRVTVRLSEAAAKAREDALKAAEKAKRKGGAA